MSDFTQDQIADAYEAAGSGTLKRKGGDLVGPCPACGGDDRFFISRDGCFGCRGCQPGKSNLAAFIAILKALGLGHEEEESGAYPASPEPEPQEEPYGCTLAQYAEKTGLPLEYLQGDNVQLMETRTHIREIGEDVDCVAVPFHGIDNGITCTKNRVKVAGQDKYRCTLGSKASLYGENWLDVARHRGKLILVEGETDAQTLWFHDLPAAGVPGVNSLKVLRKEHFEGIPRVLVVEEGDESGKRWPKEVAARLRELGVTAVVLVVRLDAKDTNDSFRLDPKTFRTRFLTACRYARGLRPSTIDARAFVTVREIMRNKYPPVRWVVPGILPEGLAMMVAGPKTGKSFCAMDMAACVSQLRPVFGAWRTERTEVLYIDLEQPIGAKTQARMRLLEAGNDRDMMTIIDRWPRLGEGCARELDIWLEEHPGCGLVVIDVFARIKPMKIQGSVYDAEYQMFCRLKDVADARHVAVMVLHHDKKLSGSTDVTEASSGTKALTGACNTIWWLQRPFGSREGKLLITGRDVEEAELPAVLNMGRWKINKPAEEQKRFGW